MTLWYVLLQVKGQTTIYLVVGVRRNFVAQATCSLDGGEETKAVALVIQSGGELIRHGE